MTISQYIKKLKGTWYYNRVPWRKLSFEGDTFDSLWIDDSIFTQLVTLVESSTSTTLSTPIDSLCESYYGTPFIYPFVLFINGIPNVYSLEESTTMMFPNGDDLRHLLSTLPLGTKEVTIVSGDISEVDHTKYYISSVLTRRPTLNWINSLIKEAL